MNINRNAGHQNVYRNHHEHRAKIVTASNKDHNRILAVNAFHKIQSDVIRKHAFMN